MSGYVPGEMVSAEGEDSGYHRGPFNDGNMERWSSRCTVRFVKLYGMYPCLWDQRQPEYKNRQARDHAVQAIVDAMDLEGFDVKACRRKIRIIRSTYWNECAKISRSTAQGTPYTPKLVWFPLANRFLSRISGLGNDQTWNTEHGAETDYVSSEVHRTPEMVKMEPEEADSMLDEVDDSGFCAPAVDDEFDVFGKSVACQLKQLPLPDALQLQVQIQTMISKQRMRRIQEDQRHSQPQCASSNVGPRAYSTPRTDCRYQPQRSMDRLV